MNEAMLQTEVCQNQAIEHIAYDPDSRLTEDHIKATRYTLAIIADGTFPEVRHLHEVMMKRSDLRFSEIGVWRQESVFVGSRKRYEQDPTLPPEKGSEKPSPLHVPWLMEEWAYACRGLLAESPHLSLVERIDACDRLYYHFECIHPFADGNGRTGRLMRNALRVLCGLPWHIITSDVHQFYVVCLRDYEDSEFRVRYPRVY